MRARERWCRTSRARVRAKRCANSVWIGCDGARDARDRVRARETRGRFVDDSSTIRRWRRRRARRRVEIRIEECLVIETSSRRRGVGARVASRRVAMFARGGPSSYSSLCFPIITRVRILGFRRPPTRRVSSRARDRSRRVRVTRARATDRSRDRPRPSPVRVHERGSRLRSVARAVVLRASSGCCE